ncbi:MAG: amidohydrolase [Lentisphaeria bacterium]|nr:amidohydrolase [Lentisphaeria bacterium]
MDFPVIDAHIHPFIEPENNIAAFGDPTTPDGFVREMRRTGISRACGSVIARRAASFEDVQKLNREALKIRDAYPDFYIPGIHIHGGHPEESCRELELMYKEYGVRWIGELVAYMMQTGEYDSGGMFRIYETARDLGMPVNIHCSDLEVIERILKNFPTLNLVIAHPEDVGNAKKRFELVSRYPNAYLDISGTGLFRWNMLRYAIDLCGSEKLLFGSDFPICSPGMNLGGVLAEHLTGTELKNILSDNFLRLIGEKK